MREPWTVRADTPERLPVVLSREDVDALLDPFEELLSLRVVHPESSRDAVRQTGSVCGVRVEDIEESTMP